MGVTVLPETSDEAAKVAGGRQAFTNSAASDWVRPADWPLLPPILPTDNKFVGLVGVTDDDANFLALNATIAGQATITFNNSTSGSSSTDAATYDTASVTLTQGRTYLLAVENSHGTSASAVSSITSSTSGIPTFTNKASTQFNSNLNRVTVLSCTPTVTWTGVLTMNFGGTTQTGACWSLTQVDSLGNLTDDAIIQSATATGSSGTASVTLSSALATNSATFGIQAHASTAASTPGGSYTELHDVTTATPGQALQTMYLVAGNTTASATFTSAAWGIINLELRRGTYTVDWGDGTSDVVNSGTQANHTYTYSTLSTAVVSAGYKTAKVTVTPNGWWTVFTLQVKNNTQSPLYAYETKWLDIAVSGPHLGTVTIGAASETVRLRWVQRARILSSFVTAFSNQFRQLSSLRSASVASSTTVTSTANMFDSCTALRVAPFFNTASVTNMGSMFASCNMLVSVPLYDTSSVTSMLSTFDTAYSLPTLPAFNTAKVTNINGAFTNCYTLASIPAWNLAAVNTAGAVFFNTASLASVTWTGLTRGIDYPSCNLSRASLETIMENLGKASGAQTLTIGTNRGAPAAVSLAGTTTSGSTTVTMASTTGLSTGMEISGTGISDAVAVTFQDTGDTVTRTAHGIPNDTPVSFATVVTTTGIATYTRYYVVNSTADTFQVSDTVGGSAKALTSDGSGTCLYGTTITAIVPNTSITLSIPASANGSPTTSSALLKRSIARLKGWTLA